MPAQNDIAFLDKFGLSLTGVTKKNSCLNLQRAHSAQRWTQWLFEDKRKYGLVVTANHIHLLVVDDKDGVTVPKAIQLTAGRIAQE